MEGKSIANAFADCASGLVLYGEAGSIAEAYASYYGIPFEEYLTELR